MLMTYLSCKVKTAANIQPVYPLATNCMCTFSSATVWRCRFGKFKCDLLGNKDTSFDVFSADVQPSVTCWSTKPNLSHCDNWHWPCKNACSVSVTLHEMKLRAVTDRNTSLAAGRESRDCKDGKHFDCGLWFMTSCSLVCRYELHGGTSYCNISPVMVTSAMTTFLKHY